MKETDGNVAYDWKGLSYRSWESELYPWFGQMSLYMKKFIEITNRMEPVSVIDSKGTGLYCFDEFICPK